MTARDNPKLREIMERLDIEALRADHHWSHEALAYAVLDWVLTPLQELAATREQALHEMQVVACCLRDGSTCEHAKQLRAENARLRSERDHYREYELPQLRAECQHRGEEITRLSGEVSRLHAENERLRGELEVCRRDRDAVMGGYDASDRAWQHGRSRRPPRRDRLLDL